MLERNVLTSCCFGVLVTATLSLPAGRAEGATESSTAAIDAMREQIKEELRRELTDEIKAEIMTELGGSTAPRPDAPVDSWSADQFKWDEPQKPELEFFKLEGYFRFRYDLFHNFGLGIYDPDSNTGAFSPGTAPPVTICETDVTPRGQIPTGRHCADGKEDPGSTLAGANIRLRFEPTLNVSEDIRLKMQVDVLDNIVLGSTPDGYPRSIGVPLIGFSQNQNPPSTGLNALVDSIRVKRAWAEVMTPLGELRFGRMASQFGMGILANKGSGIDADYGDSVDRILFATKIADHIVAPGFDWAVSGPTSANSDLPQGQPFDREQRDDVDQLLLAIVKRDDDTQIKEKLANEETILNYGTYLVYRTQTWDSANYFASSVNQGPAATEMLVREAKAYIGSLWAKLWVKKLLVETEIVGILGDVKNAAASGNYGTFEKGFDIEMYGAAIRGEYKLLRDDKLTIHFLMAIASGDPDPGWGVYPLSNGAPTAGAWDGTQVGDGKITNFKFDPDFRLDFILWRELVGTLTDAVVFRPGVQYDFTDGLGARLDFVYSRALWAGSTPSASFAYGADDDSAVTGTHDPNPNLGLEADLKLYYLSDAGFHGWLEYGILIPFAGLDRRIPNSARIDDGFRSSEIAQTIRVLLGVTF